MLQILIQRSRIYQTVSVISPAFKLGTGGGSCVVGTSGCSCIKSSSGERLGGGGAEEDDCSLRMGSAEGALGAGDGTGIEVAAAASSRLRWAFFNFFVCLFDMGGMFWGGFDCTTEASAVEND